MCNDVSRTYTKTFGHVSRSLGRNLRPGSPKLVPKLFTTPPRHSVDNGSNTFVGIVLYGGTEISQVHTPLVGHDSSVGIDSLRAGRSGDRIPSVREILRARPDRL
jgi:hypothetical protein